MREGVIRLVGTAAVVALVGVACWWALRSEESMTRATTTATVVETPRDVAARREDSVRRNADRVARREREADNESNTASVIERTLIVRVVVKSTRAPVEGAHVVVIDDNWRRREGTTNAAGAALLEHFAAAYARITTAAPGFTRGRFFANDDEIRGDPPIVVEVEPALSLDGVVRQASDGRGICGARVEAVNGRESYAEALTAEDGSFHLEGLPRRNHAIPLEIAEAHYETTTRQWSESDGPRIEIQMTPAGVLRGRVVDPDGAPASTAAVSAWRVEEDESGRTVRGPQRIVLSDADGCYEIGGLPLGVRWQVVASKSNFADSAPSDDLLVAPGRTNAVSDLALRASARLCVRVLLPDGSPAEGTRLRLVVPDGRSVVRTADAAGSAEFEHLGPGAFSLDAECAGLAATVVGVDLAAGERRVVDVRLAEGVTLAGVVVDDVGAAIGGARVSVRSARPGPTEAWEHVDVTGEDGTFRIAGLAPGDVLVDVSGAAGHEKMSRARSTAPAADARFVLRRDGAVSFRLRVPTGGERPTTCGVALRPVRKPGSYELTTRDVPWTEETIRVPVGVGTWNVSIIAGEYLFVTREVDVAPGADTSLGDIALDPGLTLEGRVVDAEGRPVAGASIDGATRFTIAGRESAPSPSLERALRKSRSNQGIRSAVDDTDAAGRFRVEHVPAGKLTLVVLADGYADTIVSTDFAAASPPLVVTLRRGGVLRTTVRDANGRTADGIDVEVTPADASIAMALAADKSGAFTGRVRAGRAHVVVRRGETTLATRDIDVREGEETSVEITVDR